MVLTEMVQLSVDTLIVLNSLLTMHECGPFPASSCTWVGPAPPVPGAADGLGYQNDKSEPHSAHG